MVGDSKETEKQEPVPDWEVQEVRAIYGYIC